MKFQIDWSEKKQTSTGKAKIDANLIDVEGVEHKNVTIWDSYPNFSQLMTGHEVEGDIVTKQNGEWTNKTLYPARVLKTGGNNFSKAMEKKAEFIAAAQEGKELGIRTSSSIRMAVDCAIAQYNGMNLEEKRNELDLKNLVRSWRKWFWDNWEYKVTDEPPF